MSLNVIDLQQASLAANIGRIYIYIYIIYIYIHIYKYISYIYIYIYIYIIHIYIYIYIYIYISLSIVNDTWFTSMHNTEDKRASCGTSKKWQSLISESLAGDDM